MNTELMARVKVGDIIVTGMDGGDLRATNSLYPDDEPGLYSPCRQCRIKE